MNGFDEFRNAAELAPEEYFVDAPDSTRIAYDAHPGTSHSVVLVVPGFWRTKRHPAMVELARFLEGLGYRPFVMDPRGHGRSRGVFGFNATEHADVAAVAVDIVARFSARSIVLVGLSAGGAISVTAAARHDLPLAAMVLISPVGDFTRVTPAQSPFRLRGHIDLKLALTPPRFRWLRGRKSRIRAREEIGKVTTPICLIHVKNDWLVPHENSEMLFAAANEPKELHILDVEGRYHADRIFSMAGETARAVIDTFLRRYAPIHEEPRNARLSG